MKQETGPSTRYYVFGAIIATGVALGVYTHFSSTVPELKEAIQACVDAGGQWVSGDCYTPSN
ncbi:hypothetical protein [Paracoccus sp. TOH]|uniref:hypothetical protein n=1 Tax=Paracoccus sp. TOH TaxID=1263728 RepID=UPI0025B0D44B|nr:hypothetical protein [Paracoccus sp. TOH]WJS87208.1 hypothetical protein NBE95_20225 [Paracoccus sp. TOH]